MFLLRPVGLDLERPPVAYQFPTTCWGFGETAVVDTITIDLPAQPMSGDYWISLATFSLTAADSPRYLPVTLLDGSLDPNNQIGLGSHPVP